MIGSCGCGGYGADGDYGDDADSNDDNACEDGDGCRLTIMVVATMSWNDEAEFRLCIMMTLILMMMQRVDKLQNQDQASWRWNMFIICLYLGLCVSLFVAQS